MSNGTRNTAGCGAVVDGCGDAAADQSHWSERHRLSIDVVAKMFKLSPFRLRLFELRGLIRRERRGNERVYSWSDCERIAVLVKARQAGLAFGDLAPMFKAMDP